MQPKIYSTVSLNLAGYLRMNGIPSIETRVMDARRGGFVWFYEDSEDLRGMIAEFNKGSTDVARAIARFIDSKRQALDDARSAHVNG